MFHSPLEDSHCHMSYFVFQLCIHFLPWICSVPRATVDSFAPSLLLHQETSTPVNHQAFQELPVVHVSSIFLPRFANLE